MLGHGALGQYAIGELANARGTVFETGEYTLVGNPARLSLSMVAGAGTFVLEGQDALRKLDMDAGAGAFVVAGSAGLHRGYVLYASPDVVRRTGHFGFAPLGAVSLGEITRAAVSATTFQLIGANVDAERAITITAEAGAFVLTGYDSLFEVTGYPSNIRIFPRVGRGIRTFATGRTISSTGLLAWDGDALFWNGEQLVWNGQSSAGSIIVRTSTGRGIRARSFGG